MEAIRTEKLTKYYGKSRGILELDLCVQEGEFFGYMGPNGAGKSTTIRTLMGLIQASSGKAFVLGKEIREEKQKVLEEVGYLPSEAIFYQGMRVGDILKLSARLRKKDCKEESDRLCQRLELDKARKVEELSFGNRKKVAIVCALQHNPRLLVLDEPTSGLDPLMQREFFQIIKERNERGVTIFFSSHVLSEIQRNCGRAAIVREGRMVACDYVEALARANAKRVMVRGEIDMAWFGCLLELEKENGLQKEGGMQKGTGLQKGDGKGQEAGSGIYSMGIRDLKKEGDAVRFLYAGDINQLVKGLAGQHILDLSISEPDLEEIFMHYYLDGGDGK